MRTRCLRARWPACVWLVAAATAATVRAQAPSLDDLLVANTHPVTVAAGALAGAGADLLLEAARDTQFFLVAEEHNFEPLNRFAAALFVALQQRHGYQYAAVEQGSVITSWLGEAERRGNLGAIQTLVRQYPHALTFATDAELEFLAVVGRTSAARVNPIWGIDQEFGALHLLDRLAELAPSDAARARVAGLATEAAPHERSRAGDVHYLTDVATPDDFRELVDLFDEGPDEARTLIAALARTSRIYNDWARGARRGEPTRYRSGRDRELGMKRAFMDRYLEARDAGDLLPRVLVKAGHWHVFRGIYRAAVPTFGNFLSELAVSHGFESFILTTHVTGSAEAWRNTQGPLADVVTEGAIAVVDFRPLRELAHMDAIDGLDAEFKPMLFRTDAALVISGGRTGASTIAAGSPR